MTRPSRDERDRRIVEAGLRENGWLSYDMAFGIGVCTQFENWNSVDERKRFYDALCRVGNRLSRKPRKAAR